jgi:hypothetical protein
MCTNPCHGPSAGYKVGLFLLEVRTILHRIRSTARVSTRGFLAPMILVFMCNFLCCASILDSDTLICVKVQAKFENVFDRDHKPCMVEVIKNGEIIDTVMITWVRKKFTYLFECGSEYKLRISKQGFVPMLVMIDTKEIQDMKMMHQFEFETRLITEKRAKTLNKELLNLPVAVITYDPKKKRFVYDKEYTELLKMRAVVDGQKW